MIEGVLFFPHWAGPTSPRTLLIMTNFRNVGFVSLDGRGIFAT